MKKMANKTEQKFKNMGKDMSDGLKKVKDQMGAKYDDADNTQRSRTSSKASSIQRGLHMHQIVDAFDKVGSKIVTNLPFHKPKEINLDEVFDAESDCTEGELFDQDNFVTETDWGESWPSFDNFDIAVTNLRDKSQGLVQLMSDMCDAEAKYAKKMREIAG